METRCAESHCMEIVPHQLLSVHRDQHLAERLAAEEFEQNMRLYNEDIELARQLENNANEDGSKENADYQLALELSRQFRAEEEERSVRIILERGIGDESHEEEQRRNIKVEPNRPEAGSTQLILGDNLVPTYNKLLSNEVAGEEIIERVLMLKA